MQGRALEVQMLEQMRHPGLAVAFEPGADFIGHVDRRCRARVVRIQQYLQPVGQAVFGDPLDREDLRGSRRRDLLVGGARRGPGSRQKPCADQGNAQKTGHKRSTTHSASRCQGSAPTEKRPRRKRTQSR